MQFSGTGPLVFFIQKQIGPRKSETLFNPTKINVVIPDPPFWEMNWFSWLCDLISTHRDWNLEAEREDHVSCWSSSIPRSSAMRCLQLRFQHLQKKGTSLIFLTFVSNFDQNFCFLILSCYAPSLNVS